MFSTKNPNLKKVYFFSFLFWSWGWGRGEGEGMARVSECFTKDLNKKNCFWRRRGLGGSGGGGLE